MVTVELVEHLRRSSLCFGQIDRAVMIWIKRLQETLRPRRRSGHQQHPNEATRQFRRILIFSPTSSNSCFAPGTYVGMQLCHCKGERIGQLANTGARIADCVLADALPNVPTQMPKGPKTSRDKAAETLPGKNCSINHVAVYSREEWNSYRGIAYLKRLTRDNLMAGTKMD